MDLKILILMAFTISTGGKPIGINQNQKTSEVSAIQSPPVILNDFPPGQASKTTSVSKSAISNDSTAEEVFNAERSLLLNNQRDSNFLSTVSVLNISTNGQETHTAAIPGSLEAREFSEIENSQSSDTVNSKEKSTVISDFPASSISDTATPASPSTTSEEEFSHLAALKYLASKQLLNSRLHETNKSPSFVVSNNFVKPYPAFVPDNPATEKSVGRERSLFTSTSEDDDPVQSDFSAGRIPNAPTVAPVNKPSEVLSTSNSFIKENEPLMLNSSEVESTSISGSVANSRLKEKIITSTSVNNEEFTTVATITDMESFSSPSPEESVTVKTVTTEEENLTNSKELVDVADIAANTEIFNNSVTTEESISVAISTYNEVAVNNKLEISSEESITSDTLLNVQQPLTADTDSRFDGQTQNADAVNINMKMPVEDSTLASASVTDQLLTTGTTSNIPELTGQIQDQNLEMKTFIKTNLTEIATLSTPISEENIGMVATTSNSALKKTSQMLELHLKLSSQSDESQLDLNKISASTTAFDQQDQSMVTTTREFLSEVSNRVNNSQAGKDTQSQMPLKEVPLLNNSVNKREPATSISANRPLENNIDGMQEQLVNSLNKSTVDYGSSEKFSISNSFINGVDSLGWVNNPFVSHLQNHGLTNSLPGQLLSAKDKASKVGISTSSSSVNGRKPATVITISSSVSDANGQAQSQHLNGLSVPDEEEIFPKQVSTFSISTNEGKPATAAALNPIAHALGQLRNPHFTFTSKPAVARFPIPSSGFINQIKDQIATNTANSPTGGKITGSSIVSSTSTDGKKSQTVVTSTNNLTGEVTQTKYESTAGQPVGVYQEVSSSSINGEKSQTVISFRNPVTGEVSKFVYHSPSPNEPLQVAGNISSNDVADDSKAAMKITATSVVKNENSDLKTVTANLFGSNNFTKSHSDQISTMSKDSPAQETTPESLNFNSLDEENSNNTVVVDSTKPVTDMVISKKEEERIKPDAVESKLPSFSESGNIPPGVSVSTTSIDGKMPVTIFTIRNPLLGTIIQTKYLTGSQSLVSSTLEQQILQQRMTVSNTSKDDQLNQPYETSEEFLIPKEDLAESSFLSDNNSSYVGVAASGGATNWAANSTDFLAVKPTDTKYNASEVTHTDNLNENTLLPKVGFYPAAIPVVV